MASGRRRWFKAQAKLLREPISNDELATLVRLQAYLIERWARDGIEPEAAGRASLGATSWMLVSGKRRPDVAATLLERLADVASMSVERRGDVIEIDWPNFPVFQGLTTRSPPERRPLRDETRRDETKKKRQRAKTAKPPSGIPEGETGYAIEVERSARVLAALPGCMEGKVRWVSENRVALEAAIVAEAEERGIRRSVAHNRVLTAWYTWQQKHPHGKMNGSSRPTRGQSDEEAWQQAQRVAEKLDRGDEPPF